MGACLSRRKRKTERLPMKEITRKQFLETYRRQAFSLPDSVMHYIAKNPPTSEFYQKMVRTCKYFYVTNPILLLPKLFYTDGEWKIYSLDRFFKTLNFNQMLCKFWMTDVLVIYPENVEVENPVEFLKAKIYESDVKCLRLKDSVFSYEHFLFLASKCEEVWLDHSSVKYSNGSNVSLGKIVQVLPELKKIMYLTSPTSSWSKTVKKFPDKPEVSLIVFDNDFYF